MKMELYYPNIHGIGDGSLGVSQKKILSLQDEHILENCFWNVTAFLFC